jgi:hypothetical protein
MKQVFGFFILLSLFVLTQFLSTPLKLQTTDTIENSATKLAALFGCYVLLYIGVDKLLTRQETYGAKSCDREDYKEPVLFIGYPSEIHEKGGELTKQGFKSAYPKAYCGPARTPGYPYNLYTDYEKMY